MDNLPYKFVWADGQLAVGPGWKPNFHHLHLMQNLGITNLPTSMYAGTYRTDPFTGDERINAEWPAHGNTPSEEELKEMIRTYLNSDQQHPGRISHKPW